MGSRIDRERGFGRLRLVLALIPLWAMSANSSFAQPASNLRPSDVEAAIQFGFARQPEPYLLKYRTEAGAAPSKVIVGAVYTPFLRVALAARAARTAGRDFTVSDVRPEWLEPLVYIAFRWYCCDTQDPAAFNPLSEPRPTVRLAPNGGTAPQRSWRQPVWVRHDPAFLATFGGTLSYDDVVVVAAFPMTDLRLDNDFVISRPVPGSTDQQQMNVRVGRIRREDLAVWR